MKYPFGKDFKYKFTPLIDGDEVSGIPAHTAKAFVYDQQPTRSQVVAETGAIANSENEWVANAKTCEFDFSEIEDPDPDSASPLMTFFIAFKYKIDATGDDVVNILGLQLARPLGTGSVLSVGIEDVKKQYNKVESFFDPQTIIDQIETQKVLLRAELEGKGYDWAVIYNPQPLVIAIAFATLGSLFGEDATREGDRSDLLSKRFDKQSEGYLTSIRLEYDASKIKGTNVQEFRPRGAIRARR